MQSLGEIDQCTPVEGVKMGFCFYFLSVALQTASARLFGGAYFEHVLCHYFWVDFDAVFIHFLEVTALSDLLEIAYFRCQVVVTQFLQKHGGKLRNLQKNWWKVCVHNFVYKYIAEILKNSTAVVYSQERRCAPI